MKRVNALLMGWGVPVATFERLPHWFGRFGTLSTGAEFGGDYAERTIVQAELIQPTVGVP